MNKKPLVSIIVPTFNRAHIIKQAIESVQRQTYNNWELIIVDDGSTDDTDHVVSSFHDDRIVYCKKANQGPSAARNKGVGIAKGTWVAYLDSDDILYPDYLEVMMESLEAYPKVVFAICRADRVLALYDDNKIIREIDNSADLPHDVTTKDIFMKTFHFSCDGFIHKKALFNDTVHWDENLWHMEEWDLAMLIGERYPDGFLSVPKVLCRYQQRHGTDGICSNTQYKEWADAFEYIYDKHKNDRMLEGQTWYPHRVDKWKAIDSDFQKGIAPPPHLYFFSEYIQQA